MSESQITLDVEAAGVTIPAGLFGHFIECSGRSVYDGIWVGQDSPIPNHGGLRLDVIEALRRLQVPNVRFGGGFGEYYHWRDGIGPSEKRRTTRNILWQGYTSNHFGTDEFLRWCELIEVEPIIQVNVATGSRREALDWMEYCNASEPSELANERARNGHPEPYGVKYWQIGNENLILHTPEEYGREVRRFGVYMRQAELDAKLIVRGTWNLASGFNQRLMEYLSEQLFLIDLLSLHCYTYPYPLDSDDEQAVYEVIGGAEVVESQILRAVAAIDLYAAGKKRIDIIVDEYGAHHNETQFGTFPVREVPNGLEQPGFMRDAILAARVLHVFMRHADRVTVANLSYSVNVLHCALKTDGKQLIRTPTYHVLDLLKGHMDATSVSVKSDGGVIEFTKRARSLSEPDPDLYTSRSGDGDAASTRGTERGRMPGLDVVASVKPGGRDLFVSIVNPSMDQTREIRIVVAGGSGHGRRGASASVLKASGPFAVNDSDQPDRVQPAPVAVQASPGGVSFTCAPLSLTVVEISDR